MEGSISFSITYFLAPSERGKSSSAISIALFICLILSSVTGKSFSCNFDTILFALEMLPVIFSSCSLEISSVNPSIHIPASAKEALMRSNTVTTSSTSIPLTGKPSSFNFSKSSADIKFDITAKYLLWTATSWFSTSFKNSLTELFVSLYA